MSVDGDLEDTGNPFDELDLGATFHQACPRTEGSRLIVSRYAVFDCYLHRRHLQSDLTGQRITPVSPSPSACCGGGQQVRAISRTCLLTLFSSVRHFAR